MAIEVLETGAEELSESVQQYVEVFKKALPERRGMKEKVLKAAFRLDPEDEADKPWVKEITIIDDQIEALTTEPVEPSSPRATAIASELVGLNRTRTVLMTSAFGYDVTKAGVIRPMRNSFLERILAAVNSLNQDTGYVGNDNLYVRVDADNQTVTITRKLKSMGRGKRHEVKDALAILSGFTSERIHAE